MKRVEIIDVMTPGAVISKRDALAFYRVGILLAAAADVVTSNKYNDKKTRGGCGYR